MLWFVVLTAGARRSVDYVEVEPAPPALWHAGPNYLYLNRCDGGCTVTQGTDDAVTNRSSILGRDRIPATVDLAPFSHDQATWDGVVQCMRATYAVYGVEVVTEPPVGPHVEVMVAGTAASLALDGNTLGIAPLTSNCTALPSAVAFAFANAHLTGPELVSDLCATTAHEAGHIYGLDHEFECKDPMTYLTGCGVKVFLNRTVRCGEFDGARDCKCSETQSSHRHLYGVLGPGTPPPPPPFTVPSPAPGATVSAGFSVFVQLQGRPATAVELWINGAQIEVQAGKRVDSPYLFSTPAALHDGFLELELRVYDDLGTLGTQTLTVLKGAACTSAATCPGGYTCSEGRCLAPAGTLAVGASCSRSDQCASKECIAHGGALVCTEPCWQATAACPSGMTCDRADDERFGCFVPLDDGGCCSAGGDARGALGLAALVGLLVLRRRRRAA
jgi:MYXO-CTERM domain-containing protein